MDSGLQLLVGSLIRLALLRIPKSRITDAQAKRSWIPESGFPYLMVLTAGQKPATSSQTHTTESQLAAALNIQIMDLACITWSLFHGTRGMNPHRVNLGHKWA